MTISFSDKPIILDESRVSIFLAGPTIRNSCFNKSWRKQACDILENEGFTGIVYVPEFENEAQRDYMKQVLWERSGLENATHILFYIDRDMKNSPGMTTNVEFGAWIEKTPERVWLGYPPTSEKMGYLDWFYQFHTGRIPYSDLISLIKGILKEIEENIK